MSKFHEKLIAGAQDWAAHCMKSKPCKYMTAATAGEIVAFAWSTGHLDFWGAYLISSAWIKDAILKSEVREQARHVEQISGSIGGGPRG